MNKHVKALCDLYDLDPSDVAEITLRPGGEIQFELYLRNRSGNVLCEGDGDPVIAFASWRLP